MRSNKELRELGKTDNSMRGTVNLKKLGKIRKADPDLFQELRMREEIEINHHHGEYEGINYYE